MKYTDFEQACEHVIGGRLWDNTFNRDYTEGVSLSVNEMREISNLMRAAEGYPAGCVYDPIPNSAEGKALG